MSTSEPFSDNEWITSACNGASSDVSRLIPKGFDAIVRVSAPMPSVNWWSEYKSVFEKVCEVASQHNSSSNKLTFAMWEGHGFDVNLVEAAIRESALVMPHRTFFLSHGAWNAVNDFRYPGSDEWRNPDLIWPADRSWFIATDVDLWSIYIAGTVELISKLISEFPDSARRVEYSTELVLEN